MNTSGANNRGNPILGGSHLKRVPITIQHKNKPDMRVSGYALSHEILPDHLSFFATQKFQVDEELVVFFNENGAEQSMNVILRNMHEQISSGRVMIAVPSEEDPFPTRKFYRCYTTVLSSSAGVSSGEGTEENVQSVPEGESPAETNSENTGTETPAAESAGLDIPVAEVPGEEKNAA